MFLLYVVKEFTVAYPLSAKFFVIHVSKLLFFGDANSNNNFLI